LPSSLVDDGLIGSLRYTFFKTASSFPHLMLFRRSLVISFALNYLAAFTGLAQTEQPPAVGEPLAPAREILLHKWSGDLNVPDPVACAVDPQGRVYVAATTRRKVADLDIREHRQWIPQDVALESVEAKAAFYRDVLAPGKTRSPRGGLADHNQDGSIDWHDLTVHTERIYQLRDTDGDGTADKMTVFAEGFNTEVTGIAAGVLWHDGWVYATIAPDLWRLKDTNDDGVADLREKLASGFGFHIAYAGHDMHGLMVGPDGRIYWSIGDKGVNTVSREGRHFFHPNEGAVMRIEPDGTGFEVYAHGLRNPQEPAFDDFGDLFAVDNDADMKGERERFVYIAEHSDSAWRCNFQYMAEASPWMREKLWTPPFPGQAAYHLPPIENYSDGPGGFKRDPGTALDEAQRGLFLLNEFPSGKMRAFRTERAGASFKMIDAQILHEGIMGVGMAWHPDGSLFMVDWIGGYPLDGLGAIWRVDARDGAANPVRQKTHQLLQASFDQSTEAELVGWLSEPDQRVRQKAQFELVKRRRAEALLSVASNAEAIVLARIHGIWGAGQLLRRGKLSPATILPLLTDPEAEIRAQTVRILGDAAVTKSTARKLIPFLNDESPRVRLQTAIALGKLGEPAACEMLFTMAEKEAADPLMRHAVVTGLSGCASPEQLAARASDSSLSVRLASVVALRRLRSPLVQKFLQDGEVTVVEEAARAIHDDLSLPAALPALAALLEQRPSSIPVARRAINANLRAGSPEAAQRLLAFALDDGADREMRSEALISLRDWPKPPPLDRVDGYARTLKTVPVDHVIQSELPKLLALQDGGLKTVGIEIMLAHSVRAEADQIAAIVADAQAPGELRAQALNLISEQTHTHPAFQQALDAALSAEAPPALHSAGLEQLLPDQIERFVAEALITLETRSIPEQQHAIGLLAKASHPAADSVLSKRADSLFDGTGNAALTLDVLEALRTRSTANPELAAKLARYAETAEAASKELLAGGNALAGRDIVLNHLNANCTACHAVEDASGSQVGPLLRTVGSRYDAVYLLESLLNPSAKITPGYGIVNVTLKDGTSISGTLSEDTSEAVTVRQFDGSAETIPRSKIASATPPVSIMPPMGGILEQRELRDVVAYLSTLKLGAKAR
jgi:quinoprotein glucose dehydrogenase